MKKINKLALLASVATWLALPPGAMAASLLEVYQQALQSDPLIHEAEARRLAAQEASPQARSVLLPQINAGAEYTESNFDGTSFPSNNLIPVTTEQSDESTRWRVELRQTLFRWDQWVGMRQADKLVAKAEVDFEAAQQDLIVRVVRRYVDVLAAEDRLTSIHADRQAIARQLEQAKQRFEVGLIAITDVQESQAAYDQAIANEIGAKRELATARELLREITGEYVPALSAPKDGFPLESPDPADETSWIDLAMAQNLALVSSRFSEEIARDDIAVRRTGHYPTIDLVASIAHSDVDTTRKNLPPPSPPSITVPSESDFDSIGIQLQIPIFSGGGTSSRVREAVYLHRASREQLQRVARETERQTRDAYLGVLSEISRVRALEQAVASSRTALEATQAGFEVGTRTIVDVLNSQFALYAAITNYYQSRYNYIGNVLLLKQAAGTLQVQDLEEIDRWLLERRPPEQVIAEEEARGGN
ncbi:MAG: TolC family outer membrane protein [Gammaproteobacteria bacterium]|nr:TolC family outer membrane protein [Gammaproteobacteria bacterium]MDH4253245.1 TolC family outer membrane protein [Gammaproteobacteria bacterium]MDH5308976.1 TolC family outer membrane protein [Gammaproteobacteria bacterium]